MFVLDGFLEQAVAEPSVQPNRPPEPEPLQSVSGTGFGFGRSTRFVALFENDPLTTDGALIVTDPSGMVDLEEWC